MNKRLMIMLLSAVTATTGCVAPASVTFASELTSQTESSTTTGTNSYSEYVISDDTESNEDTDILTFANLAANFITKGNAKSVHGGKFITTALKMIFEGDSGKEITNEEVLNKMHKLSGKMDTYHSQTMSALRQINNKIDTLNYNKEMSKLIGNKDTMITAIESANEEALIAAKDKSTLKSYYKTVISAKDNIDLINNYNTACQLLSSPEIGTQKPFDAVYDMLINSCKDSDMVKKAYEAYLSDTLTQLTIGYCNITAYYKARERYNNLLQNDANAESNFTDTEAQIKLTHEKLVKATKEYTAAKEKLTNINRATVTVDGKSTNYHSPQSAWRDAVKSKNEGKSVTFTLNEDWVANSDYGFADKNYGAKKAEFGFTSTGGLYVKGGGTLTVNLNGHKISANNKNIDIFEVDNNANLVINGTANAGSNEGLYDCKNAIRFYQDKKVGGNITLNNVHISNAKETGVYIHGDYNLKLKCSGSTIENCKNGGIFFYECRYTAEINNCTFNNNSSNNYGGAIGATFGQNGNITINNTTFTNNSSKGCGGAVFCNGATYNNCTFTGNSANDHSGAIHQPEKVSNCTFTKNKANNQGGAIYMNGTNAIENCTFTNNSSGREGGAILLSSNCSINGSKFEGNHANSWGGAIGVWDNCDITLNNDTFTNNSSNHYGGAVYGAHRALFKAYDCTFTKNSAKRGGAIYLSPTRSYHHVIKNTTITNNTANNYGGGVFCRKDSITADFDAEGKVIITDNKAGGKQDNVYLEQKGGLKKCIVYADNTGSDSKIGISTDYDGKIKVVYNVSDSNEKCFFGDNGRGLFRSGSDLKIKSN